MAISDWVFVISDPAIAEENVEIGLMTERPYLITRSGTWVHKDDVSHILSLERRACCNKGKNGMVKPAYHLGKASSQDLLRVPEGV